MGLHRTSDKGHGDGEGLLVCMGVGEPDMGVFISTSELSSSLEGGVLCTNVRVLSSTSWMGHRLEPCPYLRYLMGK